MGQPPAGPRPDSAASRDCGRKLLLAGVVGAAQEQQLVEALALDRKGQSRERPTAVANVTNQTSVTALTAIAAARGKTSRMGASSA
jgi:hypothetical protein